MKSGNHISRFWGLVMYAWEERKKKRKGNGKGIGILSKQVARLASLLC